MSGFDILRFLEHYEKYPCLWDKSLVDYKNRQKRDDAESALMKICGIDNVKALRAKIRSIRGTYNNELRKIKKSTSAGSAGDEVYKPKLHWFYYANTFLHKNYDEEPDSDTNMTFEELDNDAEECGRNEEAVNGKRRMENVMATESAASSQINRAPESPCSSKGSMADSGVDKGLSTCVKRRKVLKSHKSNDTLKEAVDARKVAGNNFPSENEFEVFGRSLAIQLSQLPLYTALITQHDLQTILTKARLRQLSSSPVSLHNFSDPSASLYMNAVSTPSPTSSSTSSSP